MLKFEIVPLDEIFDEVVAHIERNKEEMEKYVSCGQLNFDFPLYRQAADSGRLVAVTLRADKKLVGYSVFLIGHNLRNTKLMEAENHGVFVDKEYRDKYGFKLLEMSHTFLKRLNVTEIQYTNDCEIFGRLLRKLGGRIKTKVWSINHAT